MYQLYTVNYPSLRDNNILRRVLVSEVLYWTEKLKTRWMEENTGQRDDGSTLCPTEGGVEECLGAFEPCMEMEQTGGHPNSYSQLMFGFIKWKPILNKVPTVCFSFKKCTSRQHVEKRGNN